MCSIPNNVIARYALQNSIEIEEATNIFVELEIFLNNAAAQRQSPTKIVDTAWHEFILHTKEYTEYCTNFFGKYIHHTPDVAPSSPGLAKCSGCSSGCSKG
ncbi:MAG: hypothetical protein PHO08_11275 [Methylococcales bacterium]|nr:hypothetical protein [Methylococcales bacterium]MDD5632340.1 hypothetical protein [Methylococcales bacterium]